MHDDLDLHAEPVEPISKCRKQLLEVLEESDDELDDSLSFQDLVSA